MTARRIAAAILVLGWAAMLAWTAPGQLTYDSLSQLADGRAGIYNSWHPPIMAFLLGLFDSLLPGTLLFLLFQTLMLLGGLLALLWLKPRNGITVAVALAMVLTPQWLLLQSEIWKDVVFASAAIAGFTALAWQARSRKTGLLVLAALLLGLAAAARQNGLVLLPVAALVAGYTAAQAGNRGWRTGLTFLAATLVLSFGVSLSLAARGDGGAGAKAQIRVAQSYDMAGAYARDPHLTLPLRQSAPALDGLLRTKGAALYTPLRNDTMTDDPAIGEAIVKAPNGAIAASWRSLVLEHPGLYLGGRLAVFRATLLTPEAFACHFSPVGVDGPAEFLGPLGMEPRMRPRDLALAHYASIFFNTPVYSHVFWGLVAVGLLVFLWRRGQPDDRAIAVLLAAALLFSATFFVVSIACDYRYMLFLDMAAMAGALHASGRKNLRP